jgi:GAF domain-containing protein
VLVSFSRQLVSATVAAEIGQALFRAADDLVGIDRFVLLAVSEDGKRAEGVAGIGVADAEVRGLTVDLTSDHSAIGQVVREASPHRVLDGRNESLHHEALRELLGHGSALYMPLCSADAVLAIAVFAVDGTPRAFRRDEVDAIGKLASDAAVAIERARFAQALREVGERELIVASVARAIRESVDPDKVVRTAALELGEQTDADFVQVAMLHARELDGRICTWTNDQVDVVAYQADVLPAAGQLAIDEQRVVVSSAGQGALPGSQVAIPLMQRERTLGVVVIDRSHAPFDHGEVRLIELIAVELSAALEYVRLHEGSRKHLDEQLALARAAQSLTADLRFDRVIDHLVDEVVKLLHTDSAAFYTYDRDGQQLTLQAAHGLDGLRIVGQRVGLVGLAGRTVTSGVSQLTNDYSNELADEMNPAFAGTERAISVPVRWQGDLRGVISVASGKSGRAFERRDVELLEAFADLASLALHNADAYSAYGRQARIQAGFYRISQVLNASLSRPATLAALAQAATEVLDGAWTFVVGGDGDSSGFELEGTYLAPEEGEEWLTSIGAIAESPVHLAAQHARVVTSRDVASDDRFDDTWRDFFEAQGVKSQLAVPVQVHGEHSAVVVVCFDRQLRFADEELVVAGNLASAASAALERAGLFEAERKARRLAEVLADVSSLLAETLKTQTVLERIVEQAAVLLAVDACSLAVVENEEAVEESAPVLEVYATSGPDRALVDRLHIEPAGAHV